MSVVAVDKPKAAPAVILRVRFVVAIKLGASEVGSWHADRHVTWSCEVQQGGVVFVPEHGEFETFVPWHNIVSIDRGRRV